MLVTMKSLLDVASAHGFAVAAPNIQNETTARAVIEAAEACNSPLIIDIAYFIPPDAPFLGAQAKLLAERSSVPIAINLDHGGSNHKDFEPCLAEIMRCIQAGYTSVMLDRSSLPYDENVRQVRYIVELAHAAGVSVEAELGHVGSGDKYDVDGDTILTEPEQAWRFIQETGVDCLAVSIGTAHGQYKGTPRLDFERLLAIKKATSGFPLVLHGGSGTGEENLRKICAMGINKVNINTDLFQAALRAVRSADFTGDKIYDLWDVQQNAYRDELMHWIHVYGCAGKAHLYMPKTYHKAEKNEARSKAE